jgi:hypothetical protein
MRLLSESDTPLDVDDDFPLCTVLFGVRSHMHLTAVKAA